MIVSTETCPILNGVDDTRLTRRSESSRCRGFLCVTFQYMSYTWIIASSTLKWLVSLLGSLLVCVCLFSLNNKIPPVKYRADNEILPFQIHKKGGLVSGFVLFRRAREVPPNSQNDRLDIHRLKGNFNLIGGRRIKLLPSKCL